MKAYKGWLTSLPKNSIFVFGSNTEGRSFSGNAAAAVKYFGAEIGVSEGITGQSYAICTTDLNSEDVYPMQLIIEQVGRLYQYAKKNPKKEFYIGYSADGQYRSGYNLEELAYMFAFHPIPENIIFEAGFLAEVLRQKTLNTEL